MSTLTGNFSEEDCLRAITSSGLSNQLDLLFAWADQLGVSVGGSENELDLLKKIAKNKGVLGSVGNFTELNCLRAIVVFDGITNAPGSMNELDCLKAIAVGGGGGGGGPSDPVTGTNAEKLSGDWEVGQEFHVTDAIQVSGGTTDGAYGINEAEGLYNGKLLYGRLGDLYSSPILWDFENFASPRWVISNSLSQPAYYSESDVDTPDLASGWLNWSDDSPAAITVFTPAVQQLAAPDASQGGVLVSGGTQDGVWTDRVSWNGKSAYGLLGDVDGADFNNDDPSSCNRAIFWGNAGVVSGPAWIVLSAMDPLYYSTSSVATADLASNWKNASDDTPAAITVASVTVGQIGAGNKLGSVVRVVNGAQNGRNLYHDVLGVAADLGWSGTIWTDGTTDGNGNTAFPDIGTADQVANEGNWT